MKKSEILPHGIGLENVKKRLKLLYANQHQIEIKETQTFYEVHLKIQLKQTENNTADFKHKPIPVYS